MLIGFAAAAATAATHRAHLIPLSGARRSNNANTTKREAASAARRAHHHPHTSARFDRIVHALLMSQSQPSVADRISGTASAMLGY